MLIKLYGNTASGASRYSPAECTGAIRTRVEGKTLLHQDTADQRYYGIRALVGSCS